MSAAIGPGDWLLCVRSDELLGHAVSAGRLYCVSEIDSTPDLDPCWYCADAGPGLLLQGVSLPNGAWCPCCFVPAGKGGMFNDLLKAEPVKTREDA